MSERLSRSSEHDELLEVLERFTEVGKDYYPEWDTMPSLELVRVRGFWHFRRMAILFQRGDLYPGNIPGTDQTLTALEFVRFISSDDFGSDTVWALNYFRSGRIDQGISNLQKYGIYVGEVFQSQLRKLRDSKENL